MKLILCLDDIGGMAFNHRRQTRDALQRRHLLGLVGDSLLWVSPYTGRLMLSDAEKLRPGCCRVSGDILSEAGPGDWVWIELEDPEPYIEKADSLVIYRWNRLYASDLRFDGGLLENFAFIRGGSFAGSSHEMISFEVYEKI